MLGTPEHLAAIGALALEHAACVMEAVGQHADLAIGGGDELAVEPDKVRTLVEGHCHGIASLVQMARCGSERRLGRAPGLFASEADSRYGRGHSVKRPVAPGATTSC